jgi:hypothetical protein
VDPELISSLILGSEGLALGRGIERESEGSAGRENSDWFTGGERVGLAGNIIRGESEEGRVDGGMGDADRMLRGPIGLCTSVILVSIARSLQFDVQWIYGSFSTLRLLLCSDMDVSCHENTLCRRQWQRPCSIISTAQQSYHRFISVKG